MRHTHAHTCANLVRARVNLLRSVAAHQLAAKADGDLPPLPGGGAPGGTGGAAAPAERIDVQIGDLTAPGIVGRYDRVLVPFRSLLHLATDEERLAAFRAMHDLLTPDGYLAFDVFSPTPADITATHQVWHHRDSGAKERADWNRPDGATHVEVEMRGRTTTLILHPLPAKRWLVLVEEAGFEVITTWGGFDGEKVRGDGTGDLVVVARPV